jgi:hypothetical protein
MSITNPFSFNALLHVAATRINNQRNGWLTQLQERQNQTQEPQQHQNLDFQNQTQGFGGQTQGFGGRDFGVGSQDPQNQTQGFGGRDFGDQNQTQGFGGQTQGFGGQTQGFGGQDLSQMPSKNRSRKRTRDQNQNKDFHFDFGDQNQDIQNLLDFGCQDIQNRDFGFGGQTQGFGGQTQGFGGQDFGDHEWNPQPPKRSRGRGRPRKKSQDQDQNQNQTQGFGGQQEVSQQPWRRSRGRPKKANEDYSIKDFQKILCSEPLVVEATRILPTEPLPPYMVIMTQMQMQMRTQAQKQIQEPRHENQLNPIDYSKNKSIGLNLLGQISPTKMSWIMFEMQRRDQLFKYKLALIQRKRNLDDKLTEIENTLNEHVENTKRRNSEEYLAALRMKNEEAQLRTRPERGYAVARQKVHEMYKNEISQTETMISRLDSENKLIELRFENFINNMT